MYRHTKKHSDYIDYPYFIMLYIYWPPAPPPDNSMVYANYPDTGAYY